MQTKQFYAALEHGRITEAIRAAELRTSGEIRVFVAKRPTEDAIRAAQAEFHRLRMDATQERNGVLIYVAPRSQTYAIIGDQGIHEKCGQSFWGQVAEAMRSHFVAGRYTEGIVHGIHEAGGILQQHFPRRRDDINELPNEVVEG